MYFKIVSNIKRTKKEAKDPHKITNNETK